MDLKELKAKIDSLSVQMEELEPARKKYYDLSFERDRFLKEYKEKLYRHELTVLKMKTKYQEPIYPRMGSVALDGHAYFDSQEDAEKLVKLLRQRSYTYGYALNWQGPGKYIITTDYKYDHDGDIIYVATFDLNRFEEETK